MKRSVDRILTTHVGSLVRPPQLRELIDKKQAGKDLDYQGYHDCLTSSVAEVVKQQAAVGLDVINDGEFGKTGWASYIVERVSGFEKQPSPTGHVPDHIGRNRQIFADFYEDFFPLPKTSTRWVCMGPIKYQRKQLDRDIDNLKNAVRQVGAEEVFMPVVAPASFARDAENEYYATDEEYVFAVAGALREEYRAIVDAGFLLQVDDAVLATMYVLMETQGFEQYRKWAELRIEALNQALSGIPEDRVRYHVCWGSWVGPHTTDVPLKDILDLILKVRAGAYVLEAGNPRHAHEWRVWAGVPLPEGKLLIPGVVSHSTYIVEHPELVAERILRFAQIVGRENVIAGTDCGFAQSYGVHRVHTSIMWAKLAALVEGASIASRELWRHG